MSKVSQGSHDILSVDANMWETGSENTNKKGDSVNYFTSHTAQDNFEKSAGLQEGIRERKEKRDQKEEGR